MAVDTVVDNDIAVSEKTAIAPPRMWNVVLYNDDSTSMEVVVYILVYIFDKDQETAYQLMMDIHENDKGIAGTYSKEIAETKREDALTIAKQYGYRNFVVKTEVNS